MPVPSLPEHRIFQRQVKENVALVNGTGLEWT